MKKVSKKSASSKKHVEKVRGSKMLVKEFVERSIKRLRKPGYVGIHAVYSGFNQAFRDYYGKDPRKYVDQLAKDGLLAVVVVRGGVMLNLASEYSVKTQDNDVLKKILS